MWVAVVLDCLLIVFVGIALVYVVMTICNYISNDSEFWFCPAPKDKSNLYISFDRFYTLYSIAPDKWRLYRVPRGVEYYDKILYHDEILYMESLIDRIRFYMFYKHKEDLKIKEWTDKRVKDLIKSWQNDIDNFKRETNKRK